MPADYCRINGNTPSSASDHLLVSLSKGRVGGLGRGLQSMDVQFRAVLNRHLNRIGFYFLLKVYSVTNIRRRLPLLNETQYGYMQLLK